MIPLGIPPTTPSRILVQAGITDVEIDTESESMMPDPIPRCHI